MKTKVKVKDPTARWKHSELNVNISGAETAEVDDEHPVVRKAILGGAIVRVKEELIPVKHEPEAEQPPQTEEQPAPPAPAETQQETTEAAKGKGTRRASMKT